MKIAGYEINGTIHVARSFEPILVVNEDGPILRVPPGGWFLTDHEGGRIVSLSYQALEDADPTYIERTEDYIRFGRYKLHILAEDDAMESIVCEVELN